MRITVRVQPGARRFSVEKISNIEYKIAVIEHAERGRATSAARRALTEALDIPQPRLSLITGITSKTKVFEVL